MAQGRANAWGTALIEGKIVGRDGVVIPPEQVEDLAQIGCSNKEIANFFGVTEATLSRNFVTELQKGKEILKQRLRRAMLENAIVHKNAAVQIFLAKNMLGMSDNGMASDGNKILPFSDDDDDVEDNQTESSLEFDATEPSTTTDSTESV